MRAFLLGGTIRIIVDSNCILTPLRRVSLLKRTTISSLEAALQSRGKTGSDARSAAYNHGSGNAALPSVAMKQTADSSGE